MVHSATSVSLSKQVIEWDNEIKGNPNWIQFTPALRRIRPKPRSKTTRNMEPGEPLSKTKLILPPCTFVRINMHQ
nr:unnamed protein product [Callosobruchus chinensis]